MSGLIYPEISDAYRGQTGNVNVRNKPSIGQQKAVETVVNQDHKHHVIETVTG